MSSVTVGMCKFNADRNEIKSVYRYIAAWRLNYNHTAVHSEN